MPVPFVIKRNSRLVMGGGPMAGLRLLEGRKLENREAGGRILIE